MADQPAGARPRRATMKDIAGRVGVSIKSVSRVLNGEPGVSSSTSAQILATARELGFRRNDLACSLVRGNRTETIGVVLQRSTTRFYDALVRGVQEVATQHGAVVLTASTETATREQSTVMALSSRRMDGLLIVPIAPDQGYLRSEQEAGVPLVFVDRPPAGLVADTALSDDYGGGRASVAHLLARGHRRIAVLGAEPRAHTEIERVRGYREALAAAGVEVDRALVRTELDGAADVEQCVMALLASPVRPTALFTLNSAYTLAAARALRARQAQHSVALVGFDDFDCADLLDPPVTVVAHDIAAMGREASRMLFSRIGGDDREARTVTIPVTLVPRGSGEIPAADNGSP